MTIAFRYFPYLVQQQIMDQMDLFDIFSIHSISKKGQILARSYFNRLKFELWYTVNQERFEIHKDLPIKGWRFDINSVSIAPRDGFEVAQPRSSKGPALYPLTIPFSNPEDTSKPREKMLKFAKELFPKLQLQVMFGASNLVEFLDTMKFLRSFNIPLKTVQIGCLGKIDDELMKAVLEQCSDVKNLTIHGSSHSHFQYDFRTHAPFKFDLFELNGAEWVTKDHLINLFFGCKKVILGGTHYTNKELTEICKKMAGGSGNAVSSNQDNCLQSYLGSSRSPSRGSKKGKTPRQRCGDRWAEELSALGCDRSGQQLLDRLKGDIIKVRGILSEERVERNKTGGGKAKTSEKLDSARRKLYEHFSGSHISNGINCGFESKPMISPTPQVSNLMENERMFDHDDKIDSLFSRSSVDHESDNEKDVPVSNEQSNASTKNSFAEFAKSRKRKQETSEVTDLRVKLLKAELELTEKKSRNMDLENAQVIEKLEILKIKRETAELEKRIAEAEAEKLGLFNRTPSYLNL